MTKLKYAARGNVTICMISGYCCEMKMSLQSSQEVPRLLYIMQWVVC